MGFNSGFKGLILGQDMAHWRNLPLASVWNWFAKDIMLLLKLAHSAVT